MAFPAVRPWTPTRQSAGPRPSSSSPQRTPASAAAGWTAMVISTLHADLQQLRPPFASGWHSTWAYFRSRPSGGSRASSWVC